jgi:PAS domain S-box-containing protein
MLNANGNVRRTPFVLIIDDNKDSRLLMHRFLEGSDFQIIEAQDGKEALFTCQQFRPDLILLDYMMPGMDGFQTCARLRALPGFENVPIIMITPGDDGLQVERAFKAGATDYIAKPINPTVLHKRVQHILQARIVEESLEEQQILYKTVAEGFSDALFILQPVSIDEYKFVFVNRAFAALNGLTIEQIINKDVEEVLPSDQAGRLNEHCDKVRKLRTACEYEETFQVKDQNVYTIIRLAPAEDENTLRLIGSCIDITSQKIFEGVIEKGKHEWEDAVDSIVDMIILTDPSTKILRCNRPTIQHLDSTFDGVIGHKIGDVLFTNGGRTRQVLETNINEAKIRFGNNTYHAIRYPVMGKTRNIQYVYFIKNITESSPEKI